MTSPTQRGTWNAEVDKLKNRLSVLSQSSMDGEDQKRLREIGMAQDREGDSDGGETVGTGEEVGQSDFVKARRQADHADEMRYDFFFYGTLMHPLILTRVLGHQDPELEFQDAILLGYVRHCVRGHDYPAILPVSESSKLLKRRLDDDEACVRGTFVRGLTKVDVLALDAFEGEEYARVQIRGSGATPSPFVSPAILTPGSDTLLFVEETPPVLSPNGMPPGNGNGDIINHNDAARPSPYFDNLPVRPQIITLGPPIQTSTMFGLGTGPVDDLVKPDVTVERAKKGLQEGEEGFAEVLAWVYVWRWDVGKLEKEIWDFRAFLAERSHRWTGTYHPPKEEEGNRSGIGGHEQGQPENGKALADDKRPPGGIRNESFYKDVDDLMDRLKAGETS